MLFLLGGTCVLLPCARASESAQRDLDLLLRVLTPTRTPVTGRINAIDRTWEAWQQRTGEMPPDFSRVPSSPFIPDLLDGVSNPKDWTSRSIEIRKQIEHWITGRMPPSPDNLRAVVTGEHVENDVTVRDVRLEFGPEHRGRLRLQLLIPRGSGPFPVFLTNHNRARPWAATAVARGYIGCYYAASDPLYGDDDDSDALIDVYPDYDFACLARWAWCASRAVDYLCSLPEVDAAKIALSGHSRNGKQAVIAAAFDSRIAAVVPSSGNTGESNPWRFTTDPYGTETIERLTSTFPHWFHPRLRFFAGRENQLPFDQNSMLALIAPRALLLTASYTEASTCVVGFEENYRSLKQVYDMLGAGNKIGLRLRTGAHATTAGDIEAYIDFLDAVFGRSSEEVAAPTLVRGYSLEGWRTISREREPAVIPGNKMRWLLGEEPPQVPFPLQPPKHMTVSDGWVRSIYKLPSGPGMRQVSIGFGVDLKADIFLPVKPVSGKLPLVIWLHPFSYATGYNRFVEEPFRELTKRGYAVMAFDQIGFGTRVEHAKDFYRRYPSWSLLGKMVADTKAAITAGGALDMIDANRIYLLGYSLGAKVALWTAATDPRPAGIVSIAGFTPFKTSRNVDPIREYSQLHGLLPRLGWFTNKPASVPVDYDDVLRAIGDRRVLVIAPTHDQYADLDALRAMVGSFNHVQLSTPADFNRFSPAIQKLAFDWIDKSLDQTK